MFGGVHYNPQSRDLIPRRSVKRNHKQLPNKHTLEKLVVLFDQHKRKPLSRANPFIFPECPECNSHKKTNSTIRRKKVIVTSQLTGSFRSVQLSSADLFCLGRVWCKICSSWHLCIMAVLNRYNCLKCFLFPIYFLFSVCSIYYVSEVFFPDVYFKWGVAHGNCRPVQVQNEPRAPYADSAAMSRASYLLYKSAEGTRGGFQIVCQLGTSHIFMLLSLKSLKH